MRYIVLCEGAEGRDRHYGVHGGDKPEDAAREYMGTISPMPAKAAVTVIESPNPGEAGRVFRYNVNLVLELVES